VVFAPRRAATEALAAELARQLPIPNPLQLSLEQKQIVGDNLARMLKSRVAYHHSGLSYATRAGVIEPLAKAGQLRVVVATMGLAAGINFSLRSVALAGESYRRDQVEQPIKADEILQMFGRAGRRGIDETGYVLVTNNELRLRDGYPCQLSRSGMVDWAALLGIMQAAARAGRDPFPEAVRVQERLFTTKPIFLGVEMALKRPRTPCGFQTDAERARHVRKRVRQFINSQGEWENFPALVEKPLREVQIMAPATPATPPPVVDGQAVNDDTVRAASPAPVPPQPPFTFRPALSEQAAIDRVGHGPIVVLGEENGHKIYGRSLTVAETLNNNQVLLVKWARRLTNWNGRQLALDAWKEKLVPQLEQSLARQRTPVVRWVNQQGKFTAYLSLAELPIRVPVDRHGVALWKPFEREVLPPDCAQCDLVPVCRELSAATGVALLWRRLGLVDVRGAPTRRGQIVSFFSQGDGLALAVALEDEAYPINELVYDVANLDAGFRFCGDENRWGGRLAMVCHARFGLQSVPGYLENGVPPHYGAGAEQVVASVHKNPNNKMVWVTEFLGTGDIDRVIIEWRSRMRQIAHAPDLDWPRWREFQAKAKEILRETESPTVTALPPLEFHQTRRVDHKLILRRH
ncbi:MAG TPA: helicase-related protein, partial [Verrucomicrobiae bacterium]|nr:helicase-related protein [Verrucomicrobiae bacterium]